LKISDSENVQEKDPKHDVQDKEEEETKFEHWLSGEEKDSPQSKANEEELEKRSDTPVKSSVVPLEVKINIDPAEHKEEGIPEKPISDMKTAAKALEEVNEYLKGQPREFKLTIPVAEWNEVCIRTEFVVEKTNDGKKLREQNESYEFISKTGHNLVCKYFAIQNKYCCLTTDKTNIISKYKVEGKKTPQVRIYMHCKNELCKGNFAFEIHRLCATDFHIMHVR
jgi:hypothetical protein